MSDALYSTRLRYTGTRGVCKLRGLALPLQAAPCGHGLPERLDGIDYVPEVRVAMIMPRGEGWRDMTSAEITACDAYLAAQAASTQPTTQD